MKRAEMTREQLQEELDEMRRKMAEVEKCRKDFLAVQEKYHGLLDVSPDPMIFVTSDYEIVFANAQAEELFGYKQEELVCQSLNTLIPGRYHRMHRSFVEGFFANPRRRPMGVGLKLYALRKTGEEFRVDISLSPIRLNGEVVVVAAVRDITERIRQQEVVEKNYYFQRVLDSILKISLETAPLNQKLSRALELILSVPHLALEMKGAVYLISRESKELILAANSGMSEAQIAACSRVPLGKCLCGKAAQKCEILFTDCPGEGHEIQFESAFPHGHYCVPIVSGGRPLGLINVYLREGHKRDPDEDAFLTSVSDAFAGMIARDETEREKERLQADLVQTEKLAALGRITANVAHSIRNPLTSVGGFARRLQKKLARGSAEGEYADFIVEEVAALEKILSSVLSYSRTSPARMEEHDIRDVTGFVLSMYGDALKEHSIAVARDYKEVPRVLMDRQRVQEALENVIINAIDAMPSGGKLTVEISEIAVKEKPYIAVKIKDTGPGIEKEAADRIFEPFFSTKTNRGGYGLGLSISRKIIEEHGGFISVESKPGEGSVFYLYFPEKHGREEAASSLGIVSAPPA